MVSCMADEKLKNKKLSSIRFIALGTVFSMLPLVWVFIFSLGDITVTATSRQEFAHAVEKKLKIASIARELMVLIPDSAQQLKLEVNRSRIREMSVTFELKADAVQSYFDLLKKKLPNYTFEMTDNNSMLYLRCNNPNLWLPLPETTVHFSQININKQGETIAIQTF